MNGNKKKLEFNLLRKNQWKKWMKLRENPNYKVKRENDWRAFLKC